MATPIDRRELQRLVDEERAQLVEVLPAGEFAEDHLPGAINLPLRQLETEARSVPTDFLKVFFATIKSNPSS